LTLEVRLTLRGHATFEGTQGTAFMRFAASRSLKTYKQDK